MKLTKQLVRRMCRESQRKLTAHGCRRAKALEHTLYRNLNAGELIMAGDEVDNCNDPWRDKPQWEPTLCAGQRAPDPTYPAHRQYRRWIGAHR